MFEELIEQIENDEINNDIINKITRIINEERSIPFEITNIINDIKYRLNDEVKKSPSLPYNKNYITFKKGQFDVRIFNKLEFPFFIRTFASSIKKRDINLQTIIIIFYEY